MIQFGKIFAITLLVLGLSALPVKAQDSKAAAPISIAVVDIQALLKNSKGAKDIESQLATIRKSFQAEVEKEEKSLRDIEKGIMDQKAKLSEEEFKKKAQDFQQKVLDSQKKIQERKGKLDRALAAAIGSLRSAIVKVVAEIGDKQSLDLVLARTDVVIVAKELDITQQVLARIDAELPSVKIVVE